jgi:PAS domain-containing protein
MAAQRPNGEIWDGMVHLMSFTHRGRHLLQATLEDITQRKKTEEALRESQQLLRSVLENSPAVIYAKRKDGTYTYINREWERVCDLTREQVIGKTDHALFPPDIAKQFRGNDLAVLQGTAIAALHCVLAEHALKIDWHVAEIRVVNSDANARQLKLGLNKAVAIDLPVDVKEVLLADSQTVRVVLRTVRRVYIVGVAVGRTNVFFYAEDGRQVVALDVSVSGTSQVLPPELRDAAKWQQVRASLAALFESVLSDRGDSNQIAKMGST